MHCTANEEPICQHHPQPKRWAMRHHSPYVRTYISKSAGADSIQSVCSSPSGCWQLPATAHRGTLQQNVCFPCHVLYLSLCTYVHMSGVHVEGETHTPFTILNVEVLKSASLGLTCPSCSFCGFLLREVGEVVRLLNSELSVTAEPVHPIPVLTAVCVFT